MTKTFRNAAEAWLTPRVGKTWYKKDKGYVERLLPYFGDMELASITKTDIANARADMLTRVSNATANRHFGVARTILLEAEDAGDIAKAPALKKLKTVGRTRHLTPENAVKLIRALPRRVRVIALFALATGLRSANVRCLEWSEVDLDRRWLAIPGDKMKNGEPFGAPLIDYAIQLLRGQLGKHPKWVFPRLWKGELGPFSSIKSSTMKQACERAGIEHYTFHDLRHTWASWHVQNGTHLIALQELGSWKDPSMVRRYGHLAAPHLISAANNVGQNLCIPTNISPEVISPPSSKSAPSRPDG